MYAGGEGLQWYDPALLFPWCPLSSDGGDDIDHDAALSPAPAHTHQPLLPEMGGANSSSPIQTYQNDISLSPAAVSRQVRHRARELLLERLTTNTLSSDRDASASLAALVTSLHAGQVVHPTTQSSSSPVPPHLSTTAAKTSASPGVTRGAAHRTVPTSLSGSQAERRRDTAATTSVPLHLLSTVDNTMGGGEVLSELWDSDGEGVEWEGGEAGNAHAFDRADDYDYDDLALGGRGGATATGGSAEARQARDLRAHFASVPTRLGVQEEPVLCPLDLRADPLTHVAAAAEVFAVVTSTLPQVLYVFDQLNNLPISSSVLGGATFAPKGDQGRRGGAGGDARASSQQSPAAQPRNYPSDGTSFITPSSSSLPSTRSVAVAACTIDASDTVQQLSMDPTGYYCVLTFASGKCVYFYLPRRPALSASGAGTGKNGGGGPAAAPTTTSKGGTRGAEEGEEDAQVDADGQRRRRERHREWRAAARRWLRFSRRRRSNSGSDEEDTSVKDVGGDNGDGGLDSDAAYRPRGFSLTCNVPLLRGADDAGEAVTAAASGGFVPSCVGWSQYLSEAQRTESLMAAAGAAACTTTAAQPRGILKKGDRAPANAAATHHHHGAAASGTRQLAFKTDSADTATVRDVRRASATTVPPALAEVLLGAQRGGCLVSGVLTPTGAVDTRVVCRLPSPLVEAAMDSVVAICAPAAPRYGPVGELNADEASELGRGEGDANCGKGSQTGVKGSVALPPNGSAATHFPTYAHTPHFLSADEERRGGDEGPLTAAAAATAHNTDNAGDRSGRHGTPWQQRRCRWVVLLSVRNRLYVFSTPSTTTDFSELEEIREASVAARGGMGGVVPQLRSTLSATAHRLTGRIEDAFLLFSSRGSRSTRAPEEGRSGQQQQQASLTTAPSPPARRSLPPLPTALSSTAAVAAVAAGPAVESLLTTSAPAAEKLHNFVVLEETSFSVHSRSGYAAAASRVRTSARDAAEATSAASSSSSAARGTIHVVLPPLPPQPSASAASADGNTCVTAATLPPVFYWQYGDVLVQGVVLCGAGGLEVGAKVRALVHQEARATAISDIASGGTSAYTLARNTGDVGTVHRTEVLPRDESAGVFKSPPARQASGLEAGLSAMAEEALRETQDLNALAATAAGDADESGDVREPSPSSAPQFGSVTGAVSRSDKSGVAAVASTDALQAATNITTTTTAAAGGGAAASPPSLSSSTQPTVLPIGLLSVVNVNSCLQSLRALLTLISAGQGDGQGGGKGRKKCITYARCALRPSATVLGSTDGAGVAANVATTAALPPGVTGARGEEGSYAMLPRRGAEDTAALQASLTAALRHPALQFPFTPHLLVQPTAASLRGSASAEAGCKSRKKRRQEGGEEGVSAPHGSGQRSHHHHHRHSHRRDDFQGASPLRLVGLAASSTFTSAAKDGDTSHLHHKTKAARRGGSGMAHGGCDAGDVVVDVPLLDSAVARGDIDATTLHRLRAVARAYICRSPVLFDTPVTEVLRGSASVLLASVAAKAAAAAADVAADADADAQLPVFAADVIDVAHTSLSPRPWSPRPLRSADRTHSRAALTIRTGNPIDDVAAGEGRSRGSSAAASLQQHGSSPALSADVRESGCRTDFSRVGAVPPVTSVHHSDTAAHQGSSSSRSHKQMPPPPTPSSDSGVLLSETGEVLISFSPSYTHLVFTTSQGVYVLAHAAVAPLIEAALAWRRDLVFHVVTAPTTAATSTPSAAVAAPGGGPLFNAVADPAAPDMFYLASRTRVARLQVTSLDASAAGRKQFVMQLLALAAATQQAERHDVASSLSPSALARTADATHAVFRRGGDISEGRKGAGGYASDASGQRVTAGVSETVSDSSSNTTAGAAITVVVPSSLSYEVRLRGWRRGAGGAAAAAAAGDESSEEGDADALPFVRPHLSPRGTTISTATVVDADALSWRSSHASRSSSAQRQQRRFPTSVGGDSSAGTRSEAESAGPSPLGAAHLSRTDALEPPTLTLEMREQAAAADSGGGLLPRAQSAVAVGRLPAPVSGAAHFLRHANRRALPSRVSSAASLTHEDSTDPAFSPFAYEHHDLQDQQQGGPSVAVLAVPPAGLRGRGADVVSLLPITAADATHLQSSPAAFPSSGTGHSTAVSARGHGSPAGASPSLRWGTTTAASTLPHDTSAAITTTTTTTFTHFASPTRTRGTGSAYRTHAGVSSPQLPSASATGTEAAPSSSGTRDAYYAGGGGSTAAVAALGAASRAEDRELADFLRANPLLHYLLQRSGGDVAGSAAAAAAAAPSASLHGSAGGGAGAAAGGHVHKAPPASATLSPLLRAVNIPGFGVLPGSVGLPPLAASVGSRAALSLLLQMPLGASYFSPDHIYEMALAATTSCARRGAAMTHEDVSALHLVRHTYGGYLLSQHRYVEAAVQFGKAAEGPTPFTTVVTELVRAFRASNCLEPLVLLLRLRLCAWEESAKGLGGHGMEVSVLATWLLSLCLEQCSVARARRRQYAAAPADESVTHGEKTAGKRTAVEGGEAGKASTPNVRASAPRGTHVDGYAASSCSPDYTRVAWIRRRYHLDHPLALLEDTLLRYGRFVDAAVLSKAVARLASAHEAVLVAELQGAPEETVTGLVLRQQNFFAGMLRLQALLVDPTSHAPQTRRLLHTLINADGREGGCDTRTGAATEARTSSTAAAAAAASAGTLPLVSVFYGREAGAGAALPPPRDAATLPRTLASLFERLTTLFLSCYPCRFVQEGLLVLLHQRQDVPLPPRRLLPALLTYTVACNENSFEATGSPAVVLQALALARQRQRLSLTYAAGSSAAKEKRRPKNRKEGGEGKSALPTNTAAQHRRRAAAEQAGEAGAAAVVPAALNTQSGAKKAFAEEQSERQQQQQQFINNRSSSEADSLALSSPAPPSSPPLASSSSSTTVSSQVVSPHASHHETRAYPTNEASFLNHSAASLDEDAQADYDVVVLDDSGSEESGKAATGAIDEDIHLPPLPTTSDRVAGSMQKENSSLSSSGSDATTSSSDTVTPSSPRRRGRPSHPHDGSRTSREDGTGSRAENGFTPLLLSDSRGASSTATSTSITERQGNRTEGNSGSGSRGRGEVAAPYSSPIAAGSGAADPVRAMSVPLLNASAATATTTTATTSSTSDAVVDLLATSESSATEDAARTDDEEDFEEESELDMEDDGLAPFIDMGDVREVEMQNATRDEARAHARVQRARQRRLSAALHLRQALVPPLSRAVVSAAVAHQNHDQDGEDAGDLSLQLLPVSEHAVLCYLKELVTLQGTSAPLADHSNTGDADGDVAIFVAYVNVLARDGEEEALQCFTEQLAQQHTQRLDNAVLSTASTYRLLHVLRLCAAHHRWVGCVWMYYALGHYQAAVELALHHVVGEEGVRLAVRLLQLLHERDGHRRLGGASGGGQDMHHNRSRGISQRFSSTFANTAARAAAPGADHTRQPDMQRSRRGLWMRVALHLIHGGGHTKHGAQTALQLSLRSGGDAFNVTDVLPELPGSLFMAELKAELLSSVRELAHRMRTLRTSTNALGRDSRVLHREVQSLSNQPLSMQVEDRCVLCGQPALARPFTVYPRCRHLIHTSCYHHARQAGLQRDGAEGTVMQPAQQPPFSAVRLREKRGSTQRASHFSTEAPRNGNGDEGTVVGAADFMECLLCARPSLRAVLDAPLDVAIVGDGVQQPHPRVVLR